MGNRTIVVLLFLVSTMFGFSSWGGKESCAGQNLQAVLSGLNYVGMEFPDKDVSCVNATNDNEARNLCVTQKKGVYVLNPDNPQYLNKSVNSRRNRSNGFYLCFKTYKNDKKTLCEQAVNDPSRSSFNNGFAEGSVDRVGFRWIPTPGSSDGDCECNHKYSPYESGKAFRMCSRKGPEPEPTTPPPAADLCAAKGGTTVGSEQADVCQCKDGSVEPVIDPKGDKSCEAKGPEPAGPSDDLKKCVADQIEQINKCATESKDAKDQCTKDLAEQNKSYKDTMGMVNLFKNALIQNNTGKGAQGECAGASLLSSAAGSLMKSAQDGCEKTMASCLASCNLAEQKFEVVCKKFMREAPEPGTNEDVKYVTENSKPFEMKIVESVKLCKDDAKKGSGLLKQGMNAFDDAQRSAAKCACQLSVAGPPPSIANCDSLPGRSDCELHPEIPGCSGAGIWECELGSPDYALPKCQCKRDTSLSMCKAAPGKVPFAFAEDAKIIAGGGAIGTPLSGTGGGNLDMDLGGYGSKDTAPDDKGPAQGNAPGFGAGGPSGGGGSGGGGGAGGGDGPGAVSGADGEPVEKNLGIMGQIKSAISGLMGKGNGSGNAAKDPRTGKPMRPDVNAWKPRGTATIGCKASQVRCKNETIWDIHHEWYVEGQPTLINGGPN